MDNGFLFQLVKYKCNGCHSYLYETSNISVMQNCVRRTLLIASAKSLARIAGYYNLHIQRPVSFHSCLVTEDTNKKRRCCLCPSQKDRKSKISCNESQQSICGEHRVNFCLQCMKLSTIVMFTYTFLNKVCWHSVFACVSFGYS